MELIGNGEPRSTIPRALSLLTSLQRRSAALLGPFLGGRSPPGAAACHTGASWFVPALACCPHCGGHSILTIPTHWAAQKSWLASYATRVIHPQPGPSCLSHLPPFAMQLILMATSVWLRHVGGSLKRWSTQRLPSVPIISHTHTSSAFGWSAPNTSLCHPHSHFGAISPTATATPTFSRPPATLPVQPPLPMLAANGCPTCGKLSAITALLLSPARFLPQEMSQCSRPLHRQGFHNSVFFSGSSWSWLN
jgi:hypothetical protein